MATTQAAASAPGDCSFTTAAIRFSAELKW